MPDDRTLDLCHEVLHVILDGLKQVASIVHDLQHCLGRGERCVFAGAATHASEREPTIGLDLLS